MYAEANETPTENHAIKAKHSLRDLQHRRERERKREGERERERDSGTDTGILDPRSITLRLSPLSTIPANTPPPQDLDPV